MSMSDPIADMFTRIRNGYMAGHVQVSMPFSKVKEAIAKVLVSEGFVTDHQKTIDGDKDALTVILKYIPAHPRPEPVMQGIKRVSRPGLRIYRGKDEMPKVLGGFGTLIVSTPKGVVTSKQAKAMGQGGEVLAEVW